MNEILFKNLKIDAKTQKIEPKLAKNVFLTYWNDAKIVLSALLTLVKNPILKLVITAIIGAGESVFKRIS